VGRVEGKWRERKEHNSIMYISRLDGYMVLCISGANRFSSLVILKGETCVDVDLGNGG
jgi:hypothetical protein